MRKGGRRGAISPVLATVILIAITLVAAIAIAAFFFGLIGVFTKTATLNLVSATCIAGTSDTTYGGVGYCTVSIDNTGQAAASVTGCDLYGSAGAVSSGSSTGPVLIPAGTTKSSAVSVVCVNQTGTPLFAGAEVSGSVILAFGAGLAFSSQAV